MKAAHEEFRKLTDPFAVWLDQATVEHPGAMVVRSALYRAYNDECRSTGAPVMTNMAFTLALKRLRPAVEARQRTVAGKLEWCWIGIGLRSREEVPATASTPVPSQGSQGSQGSYIVVPKGGSEGAGGIEGDEGDEGEKGETIVHPCEPCEPCEAAAAEPRQAGATLPRLSRAVVRAGGGRADGVFMVRAAFRRDGGRGMTAQISEAVGRRTCRAARKDGQPCTAPVFDPDATRCFAHDPERQAERAEARRRGGQRKSSLCRMRRLMPEHLRPVFDKLAAALDDVLIGDLDTRRATAAANVARAMVAVLQAGELEERLRRVEEATRGPA